MGQKILIQRSQIILLVIRNVLKGSSLKYPQPIIEVVHPECLVLLIVGQDLPINKFDIASIPTTLVSEDRHKCQSTAHLNLVLNCAIITRQVGIAIQHKENLAQQ